MSDETIPMRALADAGDGKEAGAAFTLCPASHGFYLVGPAQKIPASGLIYWSAQLKCQGLLNHSANLALMFCDASGQPMANMRPVNQQGITGTTDWVRMVCFRSAPQGMAMYRPLIWVYGNGSRPSMDNGEVQAKDWRIEE